VQIGRDEKLSRITGEILIENSGMVRTSRNVGFQIRGHAGDIAGGTVEAYIDLGG
jgi:hypothetical protein